MGDPAQSAALGKTPVKLPQWLRDFNVRSLERTFFCVGPLCLRSGYGLGIGVGCGAGIGTGWAPFVVGGSSDSLGGMSGGFSLPYNAIGQIPGGYMLVNLIKEVMRKFPGSKTGAGCGFGAGYGVGIGFQYGSATGRPGQMSSGWSHGNTQQTMMPMTNSQSGPMQGMAPAAMSGSIGSVTNPSSLPDQRITARLEALERRMDVMDERLALQNRVSELEKKIQQLESRRK